MLEICSQRCHRDLLLSNSPGITHSAFLAIDCLRQVLETWSEFVRLWARFGTVGLCRRGIFSRSLCFPKILLIEWLICRWLKEGRVLCLSLLVRYGVVYNDILTLVNMSFEYLTLPVKKFLAQRYIDRVQVYT